MSRSHSKLGISKGIEKASYYGGIFGGITGAIVGGIAAVVSAPVAAPVIAIGIIGTALGTGTGYISGTILGGIKGGFSGYLAANSAYHEGKTIQETAEKLDTISVFFVDGLFMGIAAGGATGSIAGRLVGTNFTEICLSTKKFINILKEYVSSDQCKSECKEYFKDFINGSNDINKILESNGQELIGVDQAIFDNPIT